MKNYWNKKTRTSAWASWTSAGFNWRERFWANFWVYDWVVGISTSPGLKSIPGAPKMYRTLRMTFRAGPLSIGALVYNQTPK